MAYKRIVLATDGSATAQTAEIVACSLAAATKAKVTIAHAFVDPSRAEAAVARAVRIAEETGLKKTQTALSPDDPADAVVRVADNGIGRFPALVRIFCETTVDDLVHRRGQRWLQ